jgi:membrane-associated phospholipid phosphatase
VRRSSAIAAAAWTLVAAGVAAPLVRRRVRAPVAVQLVAFAAPVALCVALPRSRTRDLLTCALQMWAYVYAYKQPHDDAETQAARVRIDYPIRVDRVLGLGELPTVRLQRALAHRDRWTALDRLLVWTHWLWFAVPHAALVYVLARRPERFVRGAVLTYAVFDLGASVYWVLPTAPPWYAAPRDQRVAPDPQVRRMMVEYGEFFWEDGWGPLYSVFGGNPLAAMPSLHFATSVMAAILLSEAGVIAGTVGWSYALTLGFALVYLGEHYVVDLIGGLALTVALRRWGPLATPALRRFAGAVAALEALAHEA